MKGVTAINIILIIIIALVVFAAGLLFWNKVAGDVSKSGPIDINQIAGGGRGGAGFSPSGNEDIYQKYGIEIYTGHFYE